MPNTLITSLSTILSYETSLSVQQTQYLYIFTITHDSLVNIVLVGGCDCEYLYVLSLQHVDFHACWRNVCWRGSKGFLQAKL